MIISHISFSKLIFCLGLFFLVSSRYFGQTDQVHSIAEGEKAAAFYFHQMLNDYRLEKKKDSLEWKNVLHKAAYNHTVWMVKTQRFSHKETPGNSTFTGKTVNERINFVTKSSEELSCGENIISIPFDLEKEGVMSDEEAWLMADLAFENWKNSKGHNENMLYDYLLHGVAFKYADTYFWATSVFSCVTNK